MNDYSNKKYDNLEATVAYFKDIFDAINKTIHSHGVKRVGDYSKVTFEELGDKISTIRQCQTNNAVGLLATTLKIFLDWPATTGIVEEIQDCGNLAVVHLTDPKDSIGIIMHIVEGAITYNTNKLIVTRSKAYDKKLRKYARTFGVHSSILGIMRLSERV